jgi:hypothetical protein
MKGLKLIAILAAGCFTGMGLSEKAAASECATSGILTSIHGNILVDQGEGFRPGAVGLTLRSGDKVSVVGTGSAVIDFGNSKVVTIPSSTTQTLRAPGCGFLGASNTGRAVVAIAVVGGVTAAIAFSSDRKNKTNRPISP